MNSDLVAELDEHMRQLRRADTQPTAIAWMKRAHELMARCAQELERPKVYSIPGHFGAPTFALELPKGLVLPPAGMKPQPLGFFDPRVKTVVLQRPPKAWTHRDTLLLERMNKAKRQ